MKQWDNLPYLSYDKSEYYHNFYGKSDFYRNWDTVKVKVNITVTQLR